MNAQLVGFGITFVFLNIPSLEYMDTVLYVGLRHYFEVVGIDCN
ncbi:MAG TPA: hypothetical protein VJK72_00880 [Candidatus Nanoarchaeia archaeon]|nr:hypothetical protein [Candidatus Nanoarchaeia archaeon]